MIKQTFVPLPFGMSGPPTFSGHETFVLRSTWLKKAYDLLQDNGNLFSDEEAFVELGVGKNMAQSIRYWGRVCNVFEPGPAGSGLQATWLGNYLLGNEADQGWDPFLVTPASWWLLHWQIATRPTAAFTWFYTFNVLKGGEFTAEQLAQRIKTYSAQYWPQRTLSDTTIARDVDCMLRCYVRPSMRESIATEDALLCPLSELGLINALPGTRLYHLVKGPQPNLPDSLVAYAIHELLRNNRVRTIDFRDLAYGSRSPGSVFRLSEDELSIRLERLEAVSRGRAHYIDQAGYRQVAWEGDLGDKVAFDLLRDTFAQEVLND